MDAKLTRLRLCRSALSITQWSYNTRADRNPIATFCASASGIPWREYFFFVFLLPHARGGGKCLVPVARRSTVLLRDFGWAAVSVICVNRVNEDQLEPRKWVFSCSSACARCWRRRCFCWRKSSGRRIARVSVEDFSPDAFPCSRGDN